MNKRIIEHLIYITQTSQKTAYNIIYIPREYKKNITYTIREH